MISINDCCYIDCISYCNFCSHLRCNNETFQCEICHHTICYQHRGWCAKRGLCPYKYICNNCVYDNISYITYFLSFIVPLQLDLMCVKCSNKEIPKKFVKGIFEQIDDILVEYPLRQLPIWQAEKLIKLFEKHCDNCPIDNIKKNCCMCSEDKFYCHYCRRSCKICDNSICLNHETEVIKITGSMSMCINCYNKTQIDNSLKP